jgi:maleate cis-trans isomerase
MTALGFLLPGHSGEDDYPRIEQLLGSDIRLPLVHTDIGEDMRREDALREMGSPERLAAGVEELRLSGAEAVVWACAAGSFGYGWEGAHEQVRTLARMAGMPASSTSFGFAHAVRELDVHRVAVAATYPEDLAARCAAFLKAAGAEVVSVRSSGVTAVEVDAWDADMLLALAREGDHPDAEAVLLPDSALHTAAHLQTLESALSKPVLTATQVAVWEALRLADRRVNAPELGALFRKEPIVQV